MPRLILALAPLVLGACSQEPAPQESAGDFASRIGGGAVNSSGANGQAGPSNADKASSTANALPPSGADVTALQSVGDVAGVDMGPRDGGCTLMVGDDALLMASSLKDRTMSGKAVIRVGDGLVLLNGAPGGLKAVRSGNTFTGEGVTVAIRPAAGDAQTRTATATVTAADGKTQNYSGNWICV